jgi:hypothetical protein
LNAFTAVVTVHADEEMSADSLTVFDVESVLLTGRIVQRQRDVDTGEWKYVVHGRSTAGIGMAVVLKLGKERIPVIITVYRLGPASNGRWWR